MKPRIVVLGAGPAAILTALGLHRAGHDVLLLGMPRTQAATEGLSLRATEALTMAGCNTALSLLGERRLRGSRWNGRYVEANGEYVVDRREFDRALLTDLIVAGCPTSRADVRALDRTPDGNWHIAIQDEQGVHTTHTADFVVEARGHTAPRVADDRVSGPPAVALCRVIDTGQESRPITLAESFEDGWAWCALGRDGRAMVQLTVSPAQFHRMRERVAGTSALHHHWLQRLVAIPELLGQGAMSCSPVSVRGFQQILRGGITGDHYLRVGDAAYSNDPLSGHGMYEAAAGALAAVPAVNSMLRGGEEAALARRYMEDRTIDLFRLRVVKGVEFYAGELQWAEHPFWSERRTWIDDWPLLASESVGTPGFRPQPVVESGHIVERDVLVTPEHPRGVRFIDGIDLAKLHQILSGMERPPRIDDLALRLHAGGQAVCQAWQWLHRQDMSPWHQSSHPWPRKPAGI